ncbi:hypothetical protein WA026_001933 [Henosepilachna vigintioctopunctata]|uniref:WAP domain-containing protein n=1 Tax=Henosepilachna vigintioctopunctata TaxID=420089 RepID=A0AAW1UL00_9CUCU
MIWIDKTIRCYCDKAMQHSVCVEMKFQTEMTGYPCQPDIFFHDSCSICICQGGKSKCVAFDRCFNPKAGICNENEYKISNCYKCTCTHTRFRECIMIEECRFKGSKNGKCPKTKNISFDISCIVPLAQQCRYDHDCPDDEKCCQLSQCSKGCRKTTPAP